MTKHFLLMVGAITVATSGFVMSESHAYSGSPLKGYSNVLSQDSTTKRKPVNPQEKKRQLEERFNRLVSVDTVNFFGTKDSLGRCSFSSSDNPGPNAQGRLVRQSIRVINAANCEYQSINSMYDTDSTTQKSEPSKRLAWLEAGIQVDFIDTYSMPLNGASFFFQIYYDAYGYVTSSAYVDFAPSTYGSPPFVWDAWELLIGGATSGCNTAFQRAGAWSNSGNTYCIGDPSGYSTGDLLLSLTPIVGGIAYGGYSFGGFDLCYPGDHIGYDVQKWGLV